MSSISEKSCKIASVVIIFPENLINDLYFQSFIIFKLKVKHSKEKIKIF